MPVDIQHSLAAMTWLGPEPSTWPQLRYARRELRGREHPPVLEQIYAANQVHGIALQEACPALRADIARAHRPPADAVWTRVPNSWVAVQTADCVPLLLSHPQLVMAVHGGWRGLAAGVVAAALAHFAVHGIGADAIDVLLGPAISLASFEVGPEVLAAFMQSTPSVQVLNACLMKGRADRWYIDLQSFAALQLVERGVLAESIMVVRSCTFNDAKYWHSYRREQPLLGSNWAMLALNSAEEKSSHGPNTFP